MNYQTSARKRKELKLRLAEVFNEKIQVLSPDLREVLLDDIVTAFENRLNVLNKANLSLRCLTGMAESVEIETIQT